MRANGRAVKEKTEEKRILSRLRSSSHEVGRAHFWKLCSSKSASLLPLFVVRNLLPLFVVSSTFDGTGEKSFAFPTRFAQLQPAIFQVPPRDIQPATTCACVHAARVRWSANEYLTIKISLPRKKKKNRKKERRKDGNTARIFPSTRGWSMFVLSRHAFLAFRLSFVSFSRINFLHSCACYV